MLIASSDRLVPSELAAAAFEHAREPKQLIVLPGGHFDAYAAGPRVGRPSRDVTGQCQPPRNQATWTRTSSGTVPSPGIPAGRRAPL
jgi:hypothetical protein